MFKNGTNPLNLNFKLPTPLGAPSLVNSTLNKKPNHSSSNLNSSLSSAKSNLSTGSTVSSKSNASSFNSSANSIAKSLTLRSPSKSIAAPADNNKSVTSNKSELSNKSVLSTKSDRPTARPPPLPLKPPAINRRQSFDSGQLNVKQSIHHSSTDASANSVGKPLGINPIKPPPPPRFATMRPQATPTSNGSQTQNHSGSSSQTPAARHKSTQNLSATLGSTANSSSSSSLSYSTMKIKANTKNFPSTQRPLGAPPPPPIPKAPFSSGSTVASSNIAPSFLSNSNMQSSPLSYHSSSQFNSQLNSAPSIPKPPPLPAHLSSAPLPPSLTSVNPMSALSSSGDNFYETIGSPSSATRNTSKGIYPCECFVVFVLCAQPVCFFMFTFRWSLFSEHTLLKPNHV